MSITIVQSQSAVQCVLNLQLRVLTLAERVQKPLSALLEGMKISALFDQTNRRAIADWETEFNQAYLPNLAAPADVKRAALALCFLVCKIVRPSIILQKQNVNNQMGLLKYEDDLKEILKLFLPENADVNGFIDLFERRMFAQELLLSKLKTIEQTFQKNMKELCDNANKMNAKLEESFKSLKSQLEALNKKQANMTGEMVKQHDDLTRKFKELCNAQTTLKTQVNTTGTQLQNQINGTVKVLQQATDLINK